MSTENLSSTEAKEKLKKLVEDIKITMMVTGLGKIPLNSVPMTTKEVDKDGNIWFLSLKESEHNINIKEDNQVQLLYSKPSDMEFLSVFGNAEIVTDRKVIEEIYNKMSDTWFDGVDDPSLTAIKFQPQEAYYWNSKSNKYVTLYKLGIAALTGKNKDIGEKGKMNI